MLTVRGSGALAAVVLYSFGVITRYGTDPRRQTGPVREARDRDVRLDASERASTGDAGVGGLRWDVRARRHSNGDTRKHSNVEYDPRVTVTVIDPDDIYRYVEIRGEVERMPEDGALDFSDRQARRYWGVDEYPYERDTPRVLLHIRPAQVVAPSVRSPVRDDAETA
ncbi:pyridoxamine 5'-phosphate oxidase family protein [Natronorarus salvus]|uniref:pyridoxamine 5'-phosphate oxidase family protein n=1 Tax=Natronorarus salvus TaxID=3117733 RepID=UPI002F262912